MTTGCASQKEVHPNRAGCTFLDGVGRTGSFTQYAKGASKGVHVYVGKNVKGATVTCNATTQEITVIKE